MTWLFAGLLAYVSKKWRQPFLRSCSMGKDFRGGALDDWGRTARYCLIVLAERIPAAAVAAVWLAVRR